MADGTWTLSERARRRLFWVTLFLGLAQGAFVAFRVFEFATGAEWVTPVQVTYTIVLALNAVALVAMAWTSYRVPPRVD